MALDSVRCLPFSCITNLMSLIDPRVLYLQQQHPVRGSPRHYLWLVNGCIEQQRLPCRSQQHRGSRVPCGDPALRVYAQSPDNSIQEYGWDDKHYQGSARAPSMTLFSLSRKFKRMAGLSNLGAALPRTAIAVTFFSQPNQAIRVYFQDPQNDLIEMAHDSDSGGKPGSFRSPTPALEPLSPLPLQKSTAFMFTTVFLAIVSWRKSMILTQVGMTAPSPSPACLGARLPHKLGHWQRV
ncbi:fungal fucose-specific lectin [Aspergillus lentulus]|nr:fungal fucose-specific lectin [Aspergillus lentulus]